jgi:hypothetical protein
LAGDELKQAVDDALLLMTVCPNKPHIGAVLLAAVSRAPLGECHPTDFALFIHGVTGSKKSALTAIPLGFYGGDFDARRFPANFSDTDNDIESKAFQAKDSIFVIDDFKPSVSQAEAAKLYAKAERLIRNTGNQAGRGRRGADLQAKPAPYNRSMTLITGEDLPKSQSLLGRLLVMELGREDVDVKALTQLQQAADMGRLAGLMAAYQIEQDEVERFMQLLRAAFSSGSCHIGNRLDQGPPASKPFVWGWRDAGVDIVGDKNFNPMGDCIGYYCDSSGTAPAEVWLIQENAFKIAAQFARNQGDSLLLSTASLWRRMYEKGMILRTEPATNGNKPKLTVKRVVAGISAHVMVVSANLIFEAAKET